MITARVRYLLLVLVLAQCAHAQTFKDFLARVSAAPSEEHRSLVDRYRQAHPYSPLYESDSIVIFLYNGPASSVSVAGDMNGWRPDADRMSTVAGTDLWHLVRTFEPDARLDYKIVVNDSAWILDPGNSHTSRGGFGENSELRMPAYPAQPELDFQDTDRPGTLHDTVFVSAALGNSRHVVIYTPAMYDQSTDTLGFIVVHDGLEFVSIAGMPAILDHLIAAGALPPVVAIFIPPVDRTDEYARADTELFTAFVVREVIPALRRSYRLSEDPKCNVVMGASNGGNISLHMAVRAPGVFGNVAAFSSNVTPEVEEGFASGNPLPVRVYIDIGTYDIPQLLPRVHGFRDLLDGRGYAFLFAEHHDGHSWASWRAHIDDALGFLLLPRGGR